MPATHRRRRRPALISRFSIYGLLALFVLAVINAALSGRGTFTQFWMILLLFAAYSGSLLLNASLRRQTPFYAPWVFYPLVIVVYFMIEPIMGFSVISARDPVRVTWLCTLFVVAFLASTTIVRRLPRLTERRKVAPARKVSGRRIVFAATIMLLASLAVHLYVIALFGFLPLRPDFEVFRTTLPLLISGYLAFIMNLSVPAGVLFLSLFVATRDPGTRQICLIGGAFAILLPLLIGSRSRALVTVLPALFLYWTYRKKPTIAQLAMVGAGVIAFMALVGAFRLQTTTTGGFTSLGLLKLSAEAGLGPYTLDLIAQRIGTAYLSLDWLLNPLAAMLPGQDVALPDYLKTFFGMTFPGGGFTPTIVGSFYLYGGPSAVFVGGLFYGALQTAIYRWYVGETDPVTRYWKGALFFFNLVYMINRVKTGFFVSPEPLIYMSAVGAALLFARVPRRRKRRRLAQPERMRA